MRLALLALVALSGAAHAQKLKVDVPLNELETRARRDSNDAAAQYNLALAYWSKKKWSEADSALRTALALDPRFAPAWLAQAYLPEARGGYWSTKVIVLGDGWRLYVYTAPDSVRRRFERSYRLAFMLDPLVDIRIAVAVEYRGGHVDKTDDALYAYNDGKFDEAYQRFGKLVADSASYGKERGLRFESILWYHALAAARTNHIDEAMRDLTMLLDRSTRREQSDTVYRWALRTNEYRYVLAYMKQRAGDMNGALAGYEEALATDLGLYPAHIRMAELYEGAGMWDQAVVARRNAINANPDDPTLELDLGWTLVKAGRFIDAEESLRSAAQRSPKDARAAYYLGLVQQQLGKAVEAKTSFQRFLGLAPSRYERQIADAQQRLATLR